MKIERNGKEPPTSPVAPDTKVRVWLRCEAWGGGLLPPNELFSAAREWDWAIDGGPGDIVAYEVIEDANAKLFFDGTHETETFGPLVRKAQTSPSRALPMVNTWNAEPEAPVNPPPKGRILRTASNPMGVDRRLATGLSGKRRPDNGYRVRKTDSLMNPPPPPSRGPVWVGVDWGVEPPIVDRAKDGSFPVDAKARKALPLFSGFIRYFPDAMVAVAELSRIGNDQHNPGKALHWDRSKSGDELDALARHLIDAGTKDVDGVRHSAKVAWRAMANLQKEIEGERE